MIIIIDGHKLSQDVVLKKDKKTMGIRLIQKGKGFYFQKIRILGTMLLIH